MGVPVAAFLGPDVILTLLGVPTVREFTTRRLWSLLVIEFVIAALLVPFLRARGWRLEQFTRPIRTTDAFAAMGVLLVAYVAYYVVWWATTLVASPATVARVAQTQFFSSAPSGLRVAVAALDPLFEESLFVAYPVVALSKRGPWFVVLVSVGLRTLVHLYQGPLALVAIAPLGLVFVLYYLRTGRIWPVIGAHVMQDVLALLSLRAP